MTRATLLASLLLPGAALADVGELSVRPLLELRHAHVPYNADIGADALAWSAGLLAGYGLSFDWTLTARYSADFTGDLAVPVEGTARDDWRWSQQRHNALVGIAWAGSDELTPVVLLEGGASLRRLLDRQRVSCPAITSEPCTRAGAETSDHTDLLPAARASVFLEWRFTDFWSVAPGGSVEYADGVAFLGGVWLAAYTYP